MVLLQVAINQVKNVMCKLERKLELSLIDIKEPKACGFLNLTVKCLTQIVD